MRLFTNKGRAVLQGNKAILCNYCPCGCPDVVYVDYNKSESGNGKTWETAFKSINAVLDSDEIYSYRKKGCEILVRIRGIVNETITGKWFRDEFPMIYLYPETDDLRVTCNLSDVPLIKSSSYGCSLTFYNWDITSNNKVQVVLGDIFTPQYAYNYINTNIYYNLNTSSLLAGSILRLGSKSKAENLSLNINVESNYGNSDKKTQGMQGLQAEFGECVIRNCKVNFTGSIKNAYRVILRSFFLIDAGSVISCGGDFNVNISDCSGGYGLCRFYHTRSDKTEFYNCTQYCKTFGNFFEDNLDSFCDDGGPRGGSCLPLNSDDEANFSGYSTVLFLNTASSSKIKTNCKFAVDTGELAFASAPCRGNRIMCERIPGFISYAKACSPEKCKFFQES